MRLEEGRTLLGREEGTGVFASIRQPRLAPSRRLTVACEPWRVAIEDLGSKNSTFVNGRPVDQAHLVDGDLVRVGESFFVLRWIPRAEEPASDVKGRAPVMSALRRALDRLNPHRPRVLLEGTPGAIFDDLLVAVHRRTNPEGKTLVMDAAEATTGRLSEALSETATIFLSNLDALSEPVAAVLSRASGLRRWLPPRPRMWRQGCRVRSSMPLRSSRFSRIAYGCRC